jgi:hypothetical protein
MNQNISLGLGLTTDAEPQPKHGSTVPVSKNLALAAPSAASSSAGTGSNMKTPTLAPQRATPAPVAQATRPNAAIKKGMLVCKHCKFPVTTSREKLTAHEAECGQPVSDNKHTAKSKSKSKGKTQAKEPTANSPSRKRKISEMTAKSMMSRASQEGGEEGDNDDDDNSEIESEVKVKVKWKGGIIHSIIDTNNVSVQPASGGIAVEYACNEVRPKRVIGWSYVDDPEISAGNKAPSSQYVVGQKVEVKVEEVEAVPVAAPSKRKKKHTVSISVSADSGNGDESPGASKSVKKGAHTSTSDDARQKSLKKGSSSAVAAPASDLQTSQSTDGSAAASSAYSKIKRVVGGRSISNTTQVVGSLPSVEYLQAYVMGRDGFESTEYQVNAKKTQAELLSKYASDLYLEWLLKLQCDRNLLCFGAGCKKQLLCNFAKEMLYDEDVIEVNFQCGKNIALLDSHAEHLRDNTASSSTHDSTDVNTGSSRLSGKGAGYVSVLWELLRLIRNKVLKMPGGGGGGGRDLGGEWFHPNEQAPSPIVHEARLITGCCAYIAMVVVCDML